MSVSYVRIMSYFSCTHHYLYFRLLQRYQNVKAELEAQQNLERVRMEKLVQSGAMMSSTMRNKTSANKSSSAQGGRASREA
jgi:hypothetical protein